ncbi:MAG TPA: MoxR family ATPase, partial [Acidimicrobiales bacterium]|nr:MoxR family ATPase [Acidimicrobiales bacterium]
MSDAPSPRRGRTRAVERAPRDAMLALRDEVSKVVVGQEGALSGLVAALLVRGHVLLEGVPGVAKTLLVKTIAAALDLQFARVQFTPDLMPSDVLGQTIFESTTSAFRFREGPVFCNLLLADEINRTPPKTQAALLEAMEERQVTVEGTARPLPEPFLVVATQNPVEYEGTYPLPEAQLDRFALRVAIGYPSLAEEARMLSEQTAGVPLESLEPVTTGAEVLALVAEAQSVFVEESVNRYVVALLRHTRSDARLYLGASPRAGIALVRVAKARALADSRTYLSPDDVKAVAEPVLAHRLIVAPEARAAGTTSHELVRDALAKTPVPV